MRVLISGAGVAGPCLAWWLAKSGHDVVIVEKSSYFLKQGQNIDISGSAITAVRRMGLLDEIKKNNTTEKGTAGIDKNGKVFANFPIKEGAFTASSQYEILRGDLAGVFYDATKDLPGVQYRLGTTVKEILENGEKSIKVTLSTGVTESYDLLVAADGQWSRLRRDHFPPASVRVVDKDMYVTYFTVPRQAHDNDFWNAYWASDRRLVTIRPDPHGTMRAMFSKMPANDIERKQWHSVSRAGRTAQQDLVRSTFADAGWQSQRFINAMETAPDFYFHPIQQIKMTNWSLNRLICLGDAAHAPTPLTGQGTTLAILGAYCLAGSLSTLPPDTHPAPALQAFEEKFKPHVEKIQNVPSFVPGIAHPRTETQRWVLQSCLGALAWFVQFGFPNRVVEWVLGGGNGDVEENDDGFALPEFASMPGGTEAKR